jgi:hypothetical protein
MPSFPSIPIPIAASGAAIAYLVYRVYAKRARGNNRKLHAEVCTEWESLRCVVAALPEQLELAMRSRAAVVSEIEVDLAEAKLLGSQLPAADADSMDGSGMELDLKLAEILALSIRANRLADKYSRALTEDEPSQDISSEDNLDAESLFEQAASLPAQARVHAAMSFIAPS